MTYNLGNSSYRVRTVPKSAWASNIESILRLTQRNLTGCTRDPSKYYGNAPLRAYPPPDRTFIEKFAGENLIEAMAKQKAELPLKEHTIPLRPKSVYASQLKREDAKNVEEVKDFEAHVKDNDANFEMVFEKLIQLNKWKEEFEESYKKDLNLKLANVMSKQESIKFNEDLVNYLELKLKPYDEKMTKLNESMKKLVDAGSNDTNTSEIVLKEVDELKERLKRLEDNMESGKQEKSRDKNFNASIQAVMEEITKLKHEYNRLSGENNELKAEFTKLKEANDLTYKDIEGLKETVIEDIDNIKKTVADIEGKVNDSSASYQDISLKFSVANSKLAALEKAISKQSEVKQLQSNIDKLNERINSFEKQNAAELHNQVVLQLEQLQSEVDKKGEIIEEIKGEIEQVKEEQDKIVNKVQEDSSELEKKIEKLSIAQNKENERIEELKLELNETKKNSVEEQKEVTESIELLKTDIMNMKQAPIASTQESVVEKEKKVQVEEPPLEKINADILMVQRKISELEKRVDNRNKIEEDIKTDIEELKIATQDFVKNEDLSPKILALNTKISAMEKNLDEEVTNSIKQLKADINQLKTQAPHSMDNMSIAEDKHESKEEIKKEPQVDRVIASEQKISYAADIEEVHEEDKSMKQAIIKDMDKENDKGNYKDESDEEKDFVTVVAYEMNAENKNNDKNETIGAKNFFEDEKTEELPLRPSIPAVTIEVNKEENKEIKNDFDIFDMQFPEVVNSKEEQKNEVIKDFGEALILNIEDSVDSDIKPLNNVYQEDFITSNDQLIPEVPLRSKNTTNEPPKEDIKGSAENSNKKSKQEDHRLTQGDQVEEEDVEGIDEAILDYMENFEAEGKQVNDNSDEEPITGLKKQYNFPIDNDSNEKGEDSENEKADALENYADALLEDAGIEAQQESEQSDNNDQYNEANSEERAVFVQSLSDLQFEGKEENEFDDIQKKKPRTEVGDVDFLEQLPDAESLQEGSEVKQETSNDFLEQLPVYEAEKEQIDAEKLPDSDNT